MTATLRVRWSSAWGLFRGLALPLLVTGGARVARAQHVAAVPVMQIGGDSDERIRLTQLLGRSSGDGYLIRSTSRLTRFDTSSVWRIGPILPTARVVRNSGIPYSLNEGPLWAGRGWNGEVTAGAYLAAPHVRVIMAPTLVESQNEDFQVIPYPQTGASPRSVWANPFHPLPESIDLPLRFGDRRIERLDPGQSSITVDAGAVAFGAGSENLWWGPGLRNAIVLSDNAPGFPHLFVQSRAPIRTAAGTFDAQFVLGELSESDFFDSDSTNNKRSLAGVVATWRTPFDTTFTLGVARLVMGAHASGFPLGRAFDVFRTVGHLNVDSNTAVPADARDQIFSLFGRWLLPAAGFEAYAEWARFEEPLSFRDLLEYPQHSQGYTVGFQWAHPLAAGRAFRLQAEGTYVEPDPSLRTRPVAITYTSRGVPQGFTNRGETLGASIGPGASSQWLAGEVFSRRWRIGPYLSRVRWDNGVLYEPIVPEYKRPDVTILAGLRAGASWHGVDVLVDFAHAARFDYLFQDYVLGVRDEFAGIDLINNTLAVTLSTALIP